MRNLRMSLKLIFMKSKMARHIKKLLFLSYFVQILCR